MPIAIDPNRVTEYVLECDRALPREKQTIFKVRPPTLAASTEAAATLRSVTRPDGTTTDADGHAFALVMLRRCLVGWENYRTAEGEEVAFEADSGGRPSDKTLARIHPSYRGEIAIAISKLGSEKLSEDDLGN